MINRGDHVRLRKNLESPTGLVTETVGDYIRIAFKNRSPAKVKKRDADKFYVVVEPELGFSLEPDKPKKTRLSKGKSRLAKSSKGSPKIRKRRVASIPKEDDCTDIRPGRVIRVPNQNWGMGVITRIKDEHARIVFLDHYTKLIPVDVVLKYFIPVEKSRYIPDELSNPDRWKELHNRNQTNFDPYYDPWNVDMFASSKKSNEP